MNIFRRKIVSYSLSIVFRAMFSYLRLLFTVIFDYNFVSLARLLSEEMSEKLHSKINLVLFLLLY